ncbi:DNA adenine methylase [Saccharicrinis fermentans]|uniref:site-specific DNA-methyltransferase (adenine-specific) n=2 Tax=Saccharicrinis fermentans TaxID=982 RepID=W7Y4L8_9BACT|nr:DNA adenine methylase [Saccharicrinis fermentans]GAF05850.1 site-specific DNA methylase [Saccharicrinis fermentans DSM 9555 = JCM 21142]
MSIKNYTSAPLPFMGQKRRFLTLFKSALNEFKTANTFIDLFGGSGLLSHTAKSVRPDAQVVYNDYDDYHTRLLHVDKTNRMLEHIRVLVKDCPPDKKIPNEIKQKVIDYIQNEEQKGFVDYITLSSSLLFSMNYSKSLKDLEKQTMYNCVRKSNYNVAGYLDGLHIVKYDYKELFNKYKGIDNVVFFVDPPYLSTEVGTYNNYWRLADYLDVLNTLKDTSYFYFTSDKSSIIELCDWLQKNLEANNPFDGAIKYEMPVKVNHNAGYTDIMLCKGNTSVSGSLCQPIYQSTTTDNKSSY